MYAAMFVKVSSVMSDCLPSPGLYSSCNFPGQKTRMGSSSLLQEIFPIQELIRGLLYCRRILQQLSYKGSPSLSYHYSQQPGKESSIHQRMNTHKRCVFKIHIHTHRMRCFSSMRKKEILPFLTTWMGFEGFMLKLVFSFKFYSIPIMKYTL